MPSGGGAVALELRERNLFFFFFFSCSAEGLYRESRGIIEMITVCCLLVATSRRAHSGLVATVSWSKGWLFLFVQPLGSLRCSF